MKVESFIATRNIARFRELLERETDPAKQDSLRRLLAEEEKRLGEIQQPPADRSKAAIEC